MLKKVFVISTALLVASCVQKPVDEKPAPQKMQVEKVDKAVQKGDANVYLCKDDKQVRVVHSIQKKRKKTLHRVNVTFNAVTERLMHTISERGNNYSNIRWTWYERDDFSMLKSSVGDVLAEQCVLQPSERLSSQ